MRDTEWYWRLLIVSMIDYWCNARHRTIYEACDCFDDEYSCNARHRTILEAFDCIDHRVLYCETPNDIGDLWLYRWSIIDVMRDTDRYLRLVIVSMIDYWRTARPNDIGDWWLYRWSIIDVMRDTERYLRLVIVSMIEYWFNATYWMIRKVFYYTSITDKVSMKLLVNRYWWPVIVFIARCRWNAKRCEVLVSASVKFSIPNDVEFLCSYRLSGIDDMRDN